MIKHSPAQEFCVLEGQIKATKSTRKLLYRTHKWMCFKTDLYSSILFDRIIGPLWRTVIVQLLQARHHAVCPCGSPHSLLARVLVHLMCLCLLFCQEQLWLRHDGMWVFFWKGMAGLDGPM